MGFKGNLDSVSFADILNTLCRINKEGVLTVYDDKRTKAIYFRNNGVTLIGGKQREKLGEMLVKAGLIEARELDTALTEHKETNTPLREIFINQGIVSEEEIEEVVANQLEEEICDLFFWENANFSFEEGPPNEEHMDKEQTELLFNVQSVLFKIADQVEEWERIRSQIPSFFTIFSRVEEEIDIDILDTDETDENIKLVLKYLNGNNDINDIIRLSQLPVLSVCKILHSLLSSKSIRQASFEELIDTAEECQKKAQVQKQIRFLEQALMLSPNNNEVLFKLAQAYEVTGGNQKAGDCYCKLGDRILKSEPKNAIKHYERALVHLPKEVIPREKLLSLLEEREEEEKEVYHAKFLARLYQEQHNFDKAISLCEIYLERYKNDLDFQKILINIYINQNKKDLVVQEYEKLGAIYKNKNKQELYLETLEKILDWAPERADIHKALVRLRRNLKLEEYRTLIISS